MIINGKNMKIKDKLKMIVSDYRNVYYYFQGTLRMMLYNISPFLIRQHIREQFEYRKYVADKCSKNKSCLGCGCKTDDLFFANKPCSLKKYDKQTRMNIAGQDYFCYDTMLNKKDWEKFIN